MNSAIKTGIILLLFVPGVTPQSRQPVEQDAKFSKGDFEFGLDIWYFWQKTPHLATCEVTENAPHSGSKCAHISVQMPSPEHYFVQLQQGHFSIKKNHVYKLSFWGRGTNGAQSVELVFTKGSPPWTLYSSKKVNVTDQWQLFEMSFTSPYTTRDVHFALQCASQKGDYFFDDITFEEEGVVDIDEVAADWYEHADARIDSLRKKAFKLVFIDKDGNSVKGSCEIHHVRHNFPFGTCLNFSWTEEDRQYRKLLLKHFNCGVFENAFKWEEFEKIQGKPATAEVGKYLKWCDKHAIPVRGHALVWGIEKYGYQFHWARQKDAAFLKKSLKDRIIRDCSAYRGRINEYDVWNEPVHETAFFERLGADILDSTFIWAHSADPEAQLYINEYSVISGTDFKLYRDLINDLQKRKVPLDGIGVQGHFSTRIDPLDIASKLTYMAQTGLPLKITEFDMDVTGLGMTELETASDYVKMLRTAFSHPAVNGFMFWGFWDKRHWRPGAGLYDFDLKSKPAADSVYNLIHNVWSIDTTIQTDNAGILSFRGFTGDYDLTFISADKKKTKINRSFTADGQTIITVK